MARIRADQIPRGEVVLVGLDNKIIGTIPDPGGDYGVVCYVDEKRQSRYFGRLTNRGGVLDKGGTLPCTFYYAESHVHTADGARPIDGQE